MEQHLSEILDAVLAAILAGAGEYIRRLRNDLKDRVAELEKFLEEAKPQLEGQVASAKSRADDEFTKLARRLADHIESDLH